MHHEANEPQSSTPDHRREFPVKNHPGIYKRGDRYIVTWRHEGRLKRSSHKSLTEAKKEKGRRNSGQTETYSDEPFDSYARRWIDTTEGRTSRGLSPSTRDAYRDALEKRAIPYFRRRRIGTITPPHVKGFIATMKKDGLKGSSIRRYLAPVKAMFSEAVEDGHMPDNPAMKVRVVVAGEKKNPQPKALSADELKRLMREIPNEHRLFVDFLFFTSCRISEATAATWGDLAQNERGQPIFIVRAGKTEASADNIVLQPGISRRLTKMRSDSRYDDNADPIFATSMGEAIDPHNFRTRVFRPAALRAGMPWVTPHKLRHTSLSMFYKQTKDQEETRARARHTDSATTFRFYVEATENPDADFLEEIYTEADEAAIG